MLVSPLDWGLGHATRMIPIIQQQLDLGFEVTIAAKPKQAAILRNHFPEVEMINDLPGYSPVYYSHLPISVSMFVQLPKFFMTILKERMWLRNLLKLRSFDHIISDHRLGLWHPDVHSTLVIHQICIESFFVLKPILRAIQAVPIRHFNECWIPDYQDQRLSGSLSSYQHIDVPVRFVGPLSRFNRPIPVSDNIQYRWLVIASGPDPRRGEFVKMMLDILKSKGYKSIIVTGLPEKDEGGTLGNVDWVTHLDDDQLQSAISQSSMILCRGGYSTIMDLDVIQRRALLVPTPGQTEQEFLARLHASSGRHELCLEKDIHDYFENEITEDASLDKLARRSF